ncbi:MAG: hypothetical protein GT589_04360 [Peptoclostridium sp.]|uniref:anti-sigma factor family protein n=1 Tax=Peptoclostridium sp. TaxID=1904860 RepID=UPI00139B5BED|nr:zf-HC2 domain-containing protein [Peptoclostridium sp.]MZQ75375.1 hypothetical protein [Peptoclostridium sp.]
MKCRECLESLDLYIDGALSEAEKKALENHIGECESCKAEYEALSDIIAGLQSLEEEPLPEGFDESLREKLEQISLPVSQTSKIRGLKPYRWMAYIAASLLVLAGSYAIFENAGLPDKAGQELSMKTRVESDSSAADGVEKATGENVEKNSIREGDKEHRLADISGKDIIKEVSASEKNAEGTQQKEEESSAATENSEVADEQTIAMSSLNADSHPGMVESNEVDGSDLAHEKFAAKSFAAPNVVYVDGEMDNTGTTTIKMDDMLKITLSGSDWEYSVQGDVLEPVGAETVGEMLEISFIPLKAGECRIVLAKKPTQNQPTYSRELGIRVE